MDIKKSKFQSTKLWATILTVLITVLNKKLGLNLGDNVLLGIIGVVSSYILGESFVDSKGVQVSGIAKAILNSDITPDDTAQKKK